MCLFFFRDSDVLTTGCFCSDFPCVFVCCLPPSYILCLSPKTKKNLVDPKDLSSSTSLISCKMNWNTRTNGNWQRTVCDNIAMQSNTELAGNTAVFTRRVSSQCRLCFLAATRTDRARGAETPARPSRAASPCESTLPLSCFRDTKFFSASRHSKHFCAERFKNDECWQANFFLSMSVWKKLLNWIFACTYNCTYSGFEPILCFSLLETFVSRCLHDQCVTHRWEAAFWASQPRRSVLCSFSMNVTSSTYVYRLPEHESLMNFRKRRNYWKTGVLFFPKTHISWSPCWASVNVSVLPV